MKKPKGWVETLGDLTVDYTEIALDRLQDRLTDDEVLRELPIIKTFVGVARAGLSIRDRLFISKVGRFIESREQHSTEERENFARALDADPKLRERLQEAIILLLDQFDDLDKAVLFARAFSAFVRNEIESFYDFRRYGEIIKAANVVHLRNLYVELAKEEGENRPIYTFAADQVLPLSSLGLVELRSEGPAHVTAAPQRGKTAYYVSTDFGRRFVRIVIRQKDSEADELQLS
jgi:hypothetical protein